MTHLLLKGMKKESYQNLLQYLEECPPVLNVKVIDYRNDDPNDSVQDLGYGLEISLDYGLTVTTQMLSVLTLFTESVVARPSCDYFNLYKHITLKWEDIWVRIPEERDSKRMEINRLFTSEYDEVLQIWGSPFERKVGKALPNYISKESYEEAVACLTYLAENTPLTVNFHKEDKYIDRARMYDSGIILPKQRKRGVLTGNTMCQISPWEEMRRATICGILFE